MAPASTRRVAAASVRRSSWARSSSSGGTRRSGWPIIEPVGVGLVDPTTTVCSGAAGEQGPPGRRRHQIEREQHVGGAVAQQVRIGCMVRRETEVADDRTGLLRQPRLIQPAAVVPVEHRGRPEDLRGGHDAGPADTGDTDVDVCRVDPHHRIRQVGRRLRQVGRLDVVGRLDGHEARAVAAEAGEVEIAGGLVDRGLHAQRRVDRLHGETVAHDAAVAARLADPMVDDDPLCRRRQRAPLAEPPILRSAGLVVDEHRDPADLGEQLLRLDDPRPVPDPNGAGVVVGHRNAAIALDVIGGHDHAPHAVTDQDPGDVRDAQLTDRVLPTGHGDRAVVQQLVGDVDARGDRRLDGELARVEERTVAQVLDEVLAVDEGGHPDPLRALTAHLSQSRRRAHLLVVHQQRHRVAADAGADEHVVGNLGPPVVRASGAEVRRSLDAQRDQRALASGWWFGLEPPAEPPLEARPEGRRDQVGHEHAVADQELVAVVVAFAEHAEARPACRTARPSSTVRASGPSPRRRRPRRALDRTPGRRRRRRATAAGAATCGSLRRRSPRRPTVRGGATPREPRRR